MLRPHLSLLALLLSANASLAAAARCNGHEALCSRKYSNVTQVGAHNSAFVGVGPAHNQYISATAALDMGVRFLQAQTHRWLDDGIHMCHTSCVILDAGPLRHFLAPIKAWIDGHPDDVVTLLLTNPDAIPVAEYDAVFADLGLDRYAFVPGSGKPGGAVGPDDWPTLAELIATGRRLVVFMDYHADEAAVPYVLDEFDYLFETPFDVTDPDFRQCDLDRPAGASPDGRMYIVNHFLAVDLFGIKIPDQVRAPRTNSAANILAQTDLCESKWGRVPNFVLLDWIDKGQPLVAERDLNNL